METLIIADNPEALRLAQEVRDVFGEVVIAQSPGTGFDGVPTVDVKRSARELVAHPLIISMHCRQVFPPELVTGTRCVNVHPGLNPYNRGWYPHVFSLINGLPVGVTIHAMDEQVDHGDIIVQRECRIESWDTSGTVFQRLLELERELVMEHFASIRDGEYKLTPPVAEGNLNSKRDFEALRLLARDERGTFEGFLNRLRALTHGDYKNAYFIDDSGRRVFVRVALEPDTTS